MICLESLFWPNKQIWTCNACNKSVHLSCMLKWAKKLSENLGSQSTSAESREEFALELHLVNCPHCNFIYETCNLVYKCFCGKVENPGEVYGSQHSCGKKCNRFLSTKCEHLCREICHFGKCLPCEILVTASCFCKKTKKEVDCFQQNKGETDKGCGQICGKALNCGSHKCKQKCHSGVCAECTQKIIQKCFCGKQETASQCGKDFSCGEICRKILACGQHQCQVKCHSGECRNCDFKVLKGEHCACGKKSVQQILLRARSSCAEKIPGCSQICGIKKKCGHICDRRCEEQSKAQSLANLSNDKCPHACEVELEVFCQCKGEKFSVLCSENGPVKCWKKCGKSMSCGRHKCQTICCKSRTKKQSHPCRKICSKPTLCGKHICVERCHQGPCKKCEAWESRDKVCACGDKVLRAPVACSFSVPVCFKRCNKKLQCEHRCYFKCHFGDCPPCEELLTKPCKCGKQMLSGKCFQTLRCSTKCLNNFSCGHSCQFKCHIPSECFHLNFSKNSDQPNLTAYKGSGALWNRFLNNFKVIYKNIHLQAPQSYTEQQMVYISRFQSSQWTETLCKSISESNSHLKDLIYKNILSHPENPCFTQCLQTQECGHQCKLPCHFPVACPPKLFCSVKVKVSCKCGQHTSKVSCSLNFQKVQLPCQEKCFNFLKIKQHYAHNQKSFKINFTEYLLVLGKIFPKYLTKLENKLEKLLIDPSTTSLELSIKLANRAKISLVKILVQNYYNIKVVLRKNKTQRILQCSKAPQSCVPQMRLSHYIETSHGNPKLKKEHQCVKVHFHNLPKNSRRHDLYSLLGNFETHIYVQRNSLGFVLYLWDRSDIFQIKEQLFRSNGTFSIFHVDDPTQKPTAFVKSDFAFKNNPSSANTQHRKVYLFNRKHGYKIIKNMFEKLA